MIAIATGINELDELLKTQISNSRIINYREYLFKEKFDLVIISSYLFGEVEIENIVYYLKENGTRIIFLSNMEQLDIVKICFKYGVYDLVFDPITAEKILEILYTPKEFKDISKIFLKIFGEENTIKTNNIEKGYSKFKKDKLKVNVEHDENHVERNNKGRNDEDKKSIEREKKDNNLNLEVLTINKSTCEEKFKSDVSEDNEINTENIDMLSRKQEKLIKEKLEKINIERLNEKKEMERIIKELKEKLEEETNKEPVVINKVVEKITPMYVIDSTSIAIISNASNGKSFISWLISNCFSSYEYTTSIISLDRNCSMNYYFNIEEGYFDMLLEDNGENNFSNIFEKRYKSKENLNIITGKALKRIDINKEGFEELFNIVRSKSDITIIDCETGLNDITKMAISQSNVNIVVFDSNPMNFYLNLSMLEELKDRFIPEKTIAIINNIFYDSKSFEHINDLVKGMNYKFKSIITVENCGSLAIDALLENSTPYDRIDIDSRFRKDVNNLITALKIKNEVKKKSGYKNAITGIRNSLYYLITEIGNMALMMLKHKAIFFLLFISIIVYFYVKEVLKNSF